MLWDVDRTLLVTGRVTVDAFGAAFTALTGRAWVPRPLDASGRCDLWIAPAFFAQHGVDFDDPPTFFRRYAAEYHDRRDRVAAEGALLPGAADVLAGLAARPGVVQSLVTGNIRPVAATKVTAFGLDRHLDLDAGGYGDDSADRAEITRRAVQRARERHGPFDALVVVGDTPHDVAAGRAVGALTVGVATGRSPAADLVAAGADHVLPDLADAAAATALLAGG